MNFGFLMGEENKPESLRENPFSEIEGYCLDLEGLLHVGTSSANSLFAGKIRDANKRAEEMYDKAVASVGFDLLTGLPTKKILERDFYRARSYLSEYGIPFSVAILDFDGFTQADGVYGADVGDIVLKEVAQRVKGSIWKLDEAYRFGGDEVAVVCSGRSGFKAYDFIDSMRKAICLDGINIGIGRPLNFSLSGGVSSVGAKDEFNYIIEQTSGALYEAKKHGGNKIVLYEQR